MTKKTEKRKTKKVWKKNVSKRETWKNGRSYNVTRDRSGQWVTSHKIRHYERRKPLKKKPGVTIPAVTPKHVAAYGKTLNETDKHWKDNRIEISGQGKDIMEAMIMMRHGKIPRKPYQKVSAEALLDDPDKYLEEGEWVGVEGMEWEYA